MLNEKQILVNGLNPKYIFDSFIVGKSNYNAYYMSLYFAKSINENQILFISGASGLGKTHLLNAIGNYIVENTDKKVLYITSEEFIVDYFKSIKDNQYSFDYDEYFEYKYQNIDVLIVDNIQFLDGAIHTQQKFLKVFQSLCNNKKQIIISSSKKIENLNLDEILKYNLRVAIKVELEPSNYNFKLRTLKNLIKDTALYNVSENVVKFICSKVPNDFRNLQKTVNKLLAYTLINNVKFITKEDVANIL